MQSQAEFGTYEAAEKYSERCYSERSEESLPERKALARFLVTEPAPSAVEGAPQNDICGEFFIDLLQPHFG